MPCKWLYMCMTAPNILPLTCIDEAECNSHSTQMSPCTYPFMMAKLNCVMHVHVCLFVLRINIRVLSLLIQPLRIRGPKRGNVPIDVYIYKQLLIYGIDSAAHVAIIVVWIVAIYTEYLYSCIG